MDINNKDLQLYDAYCDDDCGDVIREQVYAKTRNQAINIIKAKWIEKYKCININQNGYYVGASLIRTNNESAN